MISLNRRQDNIHSYSTIVLLLLLLLAGLAGNKPASAQDELHQNKGLVVVVCNHLDLNDFRGDLPLSLATRDFSFALVSPVAAGIRDLGSLYASASAGASATSSGIFGKSYNTSEKILGEEAKSIYARLTGYPEPQRGIICPDIAALYRANSRLPSQADPSFLGERLRLANIPRAAFGNSDTKYSACRLSASILADRRGRVWTGDVSDTILIKDSKAPGGYRTNIQEIIRQVLPVLKLRGVAAIEFGDLARLEADRQSYVSAVLTEERKRALNNLADLVVQLKKEQPNASVVILSLVRAGSTDYYGKRMGIIAIRSKHAPIGLLSSPTTKTKGIISTIDIAPTLLQLSGVEAAHPVPGKPAFHISDQNVYPILERWDTSLILEEIVRLPIIMGLGLLAAISVILAILVITGSLQEQFISKMATLILAIVCWIPAVLLVPLDQPHFYPLVIVLTLFSFALSGIMGGSNRHLAIEFPAIVTLILISASAAGILDWVQRSPLSSYQLSGFRYYGIGNEYMGCLVGAAAIIPLWRAGRYQKKFSGVLLTCWFVFWTLIIGLPWLGANAGGAITASAAFILTGRVIQGNLVRLRDAVLAAIAGIAVAVAFAVFDSLASFQPGHQGAAFHSLARGGTEALISIIERKLNTSYSVIFRVETLAALFIALITAMTATWYYPRIRLVFKPTGTLKQGITAFLYASVIALLFNDSGIVSGAFILSYLSMWIIWDAITIKAGGVPVIMVRDANSRG